MFQIQNHLMLSVWSSSRKANKARVLILQSRFLDLQTEAGGSQVSRPDPRRKKWLGPPLCITLNKNILDKSNVSLEREEKTELCDYYVMAQTYTKEGKEDSGLSKPLSGPRYSSSG